MQGLEAGSVAAHQDIIVEQEKRQHEGDSIAPCLPDRWHHTYTAAKSLPNYYIADWMHNGPPQKSDVLIDLIDAFCQGSSRLTCLVFLLG